MKTLAHFLWSLPVRTQRCVRKYINETEHQPEKYMKAPRSPLACAHIIAEAKVQQPTQLETWEEITEQVMGEKPKEA